MDRSTKRTLAAILPLVGILAFIVPSSLLAPDVARFVGIGAFLAVGAVHALPTTEEREGHDDAPSAADR